MFKYRMRHTPIGLDIGAASVKMIQFASDGNQPAVHAAAWREITAPAGDGEKRDEAVRTAISECLARGRFYGRSVVCSLAVGEFQIKSLRLPPMPREELAGAVEFEAQDRFNLPAGTAQFRFLPAGEVRHGNEIKEEIIVFAGSNDLIRARLAMLESLKLRPIAIDATPCAMARSFVRFLRRTDDVSAVNVFLDFGYRASSVVVTRGTEVTFLKVVDIGGVQLNAAVAQALGISPSEAANLRVRVMRNQGGRRTGEQEPIAQDLVNTVADAVRPCLERLSREVHLCLRYFAVTFRGQRPASVTFVGGEAHEPTLAAVIGDGLEVPCTIGNPLRGIQNAGAACGPDRRTLQPAWAVATGLALRSSPWVQPRWSAALNTNRSSAPLPV